MEEQISPGVVDWPAVQAHLREQGIVLIGGGADEAPEVYKRLPEVLAAHGDSIRVKHTLRPLGVAMAGRDVVDPIQGTEGRAGSPRSFCDRGFPPASTQGARRGVPGRGLLQAPQARGWTCRNPWLGGLKRYAVRSPLDLRKPRGSMGIRSRGNRLPPFRLETGRLERRRLVVHGRVARLRSSLAVAALALALGLLFVSTSAGAAGRRLSLGLLGNPGRFDGQTGQHSRVRLLIVGWGQGGSRPYFSSLLATMLDEPMLGLSTGPGSGEAITPAQIAHGAGDAYLVAINQALADWGKPVYVRPFAEMNGYWNAYSAFNQNGSPRDAAHSTAAFRKAFARVYLILHGGAGVNGRLARLGLPPVQGALQADANVRVVWNPQGYGDPDLPGNSAQAYYPGDRYVDVVGDDLYDIRGKASWDAAEALYKAHPGKPFSFPEWGFEIRRSACVTRWRRSSAPTLGPRSRTTTRAGRARSSTSPRSRAHITRTG